VTIRSEEAMGRAHIQFLLVAAVLCACTAAFAQTVPQLEPRTADGSGLAQGTVLDAQITAPVTIPNEAWGHYTFGHQLDLLEIDLERQGVTGYITLLGEKGGPDKNAPLTFFFSKTRVGGNAIYFATQQIHHVSYEFTGSLDESAPEPHTLLVDYSLTGTLTVHHRGDDGSDRKETRRVVFKKVNLRMR